MNGVSDYYGNNRTDNQQAEVNPIIEVFPVLTRTKTSGSLGIVTNTGPCTTLKFIKNLFIYSLIYL